MKYRLYGAMFAMCSAGAASANEYLTEVASEVYQTTGTPKEIATRAVTCISQHLAPGTTDSQLIISSDLDGGIIVARNALEYGSLSRWKIRSRFTFEARDGRFRIRQAMLERLASNSLTGVIGWSPIGEWPGSDWKKVNDLFAGAAAEVAKCVSDAHAENNW